MIQTNIIFKPYPFRRPHPIPFRKSYKKGGNDWEKAEYRKKNKKRSNKKIKHFIFFHPAEKGCFFRNFNRTSLRDQVFVYYYISIHFIPPNECAESRMIGPSTPQTKIYYFLTLEFTSLTACSNASFIVMLPNVIFVINLRTASFAIGSFSVGNGIPIFPWTLLKISFVT